MNSKFILKEDIYRDFLNLVDEETLKSEICQSPPLTIMYIKNQSNRIQKIAIKRNTDSFPFLINPSLELKLEVLKKDGIMIYYIKNPSEEEQLTALYQNPRTFQHIKNPTRKVKLKAVFLDSNNLKYIKNPDQEIKIEAIKNDQRCLVNFRKPNSLLQKIAIESYVDEFLFVNECLHKITDPINLVYLYNKVVDFDLKEKIKLSPYWKDDANIILDYII